MKNINLYFKEALRTSNNETYIKEEKKILPLLRKNLSEYIKKSDNIGKGISDDALYYRIGKYKFNWISGDRKKIIIDKYNIDEDDLRPGIIRWMRDVRFSSTHQYYRRAYRL